MQQAPSLIFPDSTVAACTAAARGTNLDQRSFLRRSVTGDVVDAYVERVRSPASAPLMASS